MRPVKPDFVTVDLPDWLYGDDPEQFGVAAHWEMKRNTGSARSWEVRLVERSTGVDAKLVELHVLANASSLASLPNHLHLLGLPPLTTSPLGAYGAPTQIAIKKILNDRPGDLAAIAYCLGLQTTVAWTEELPEIVEKALVDQLLPLHKDATAFLIRLDPALTLRFSATRLLLQMQDDPSLLTSRPIPGTDGLIFMSSRHLFNDTTIGLQSYLAPLFLSCALWVWAAYAGRPGGVIAYSFGELVIGRRMEASELLQLAEPMAPLVTRYPPAVTSPDLEAALKWWVFQLDKLFTEVTDPCHFVTDTGAYDVVSHFEQLLSLEQVFRTVQSISVHDRDGHAQRSLLFDALDTFEALRKPDFDAMCKLSVATKALEEVEASMSEDVARVLIPRARAAVEALRELQDGFFLKSRVSPAGVRLPDKSGETTYPLDEAAGFFLRVLRNSVHGFGGRKGLPGERESALLSSHNGRLPKELPDLAYLYLLRLLATPEDLRL
jgi:hypothetical protein